MDSHLLFTSSHIFNAVYIFCLADNLAWNTDEILHQLLFCFAGCHSSLRAPVRKLLNHLIKGWVWGTLFPEDDSSRSRTDGREGGITHTLF